MVLINSSLAHETWPDLASWRKWVDEAYTVTSIMTLDDVWRHKNATIGVLSAASYNQ